MTTDYDDQQYDNLYHDHETLKEAVRNLLNSLDDVGMCEREVEDLLNR